MLFGTDDPATSKIRGRSPRRRSLCPADPPVRAKPAAASGAAGHRRGEPSVSVNREVTVPVRTATVRASHAPLSEGATEPVWAVPRRSTACERWGPGPRLPYGEPAPYTCTAGALPDRSMARPSSPRYEATTRGSDRTTDGDPRVTT